MDCEFIWDKEQWKRDAFSMIKKSLYFARDNNLAGRYDSAREEHLVIVYGVTQIGKTSLILNLIGISEKYFDEVYDTLRAERKKGNSSTSTAIIYTRTDSDKYGCVVRPINSYDGAMEYFDSDQMVRRLQQIRQDVYDKKIKSNEILYIAIPQKYFEKNTPGDNISIIDLPGDNSKDRGEMAHAANLLTRYIPIASTCIIACRSGQIENLKALELPNHINWKILPHRFMIVITHAFGDGGAKRLLEGKSTTADKFRESIRKYYEDSMKRVLGESSKIECYPVDMGMSLGALREQIRTAEELSAVNQARDAALLDIRKAIVRRNGDKLHTALADLQEIIKYNSQNRRNAVESKIPVKEKDKSDLEQHNRDLENSISLGKDEIKKLRDKIKPLASFESDAAGIKEIDADELWEKIDSWIRGDTDSEKDKYHHRNKDNTHVRGKYQAMVSNHIHEAIDEEAGNRIRQFNLFDSVGTVRAEIKNEAVKAPLDELFADTFTKAGWKDFARNKLKAFVEKAANLINEKMQICITNAKEIINKEIDNLTDVINRQENLITVNKDRIGRNNSAITNINIDVENLHGEARSYESRAEDDREILNNYISYAHRAYMEYRNKMVDYINSSRSSAEEKLTFALYLGVLDRDYIKTVGGD